MLDRERERFDLQESRFADQAVDVDTQGMRSQFGIQASAQTPKGMSVIDLNIELAGKLCIDRFNHLADRILSVFQGAWKLLLLITTWNGCELNAVLFPKLSCFLGTDIGFIAQDLHVGML